MVSKYPTQNPYFKEPQNPQKNTTQFCRSIFGGSSQPTLWMVIPQGKSHGTWQQSGRHLCGLFRGQIRGEDLAGPAEKSADWKSYPLVI